MSIVKKLNETFKKALGEAVNFIKDEEHEILNYVDANINDYYINDTGNLNNEFGEFKNQWILTYGNRYDVNTLVLSDMDYKKLISIEDISTNDLEKIEEFFKKHNIKHEHRVLKGM